MKEIPFFRELRRPLYPQGLKWHVRSRPGRSELAITSDWTIIAPEDASRQVMLAARDLLAFLADAGVRVKIRTSPRSGSTRAIVLQRSPRSAALPESYTIRVKPGSVVVEGADDSGIMYGVFQLEEQMRLRAAPILKVGALRRKPILRSRILRSPMSSFHVRELHTVLDAYPENYLLKMAHHGFNGIWVRGKLRDMSKTTVFPEFGRGSARIVKNLNELVRRAADYGIRVYLFFNEPLAVPTSSRFWMKHARLKGQPHPSEEVVALCTSTPNVQRFLRDGMRYLFGHVAGLAGVILITASEHHTHCFSHLRTYGRSRRQWQQEMRCRRCRQRTPREVIGEVVACIAEGVRAAAPAAEVIAWNWAWSMYEDDPQASVVRALPADVAVMADFERGGKRVTNGVHHLVDEYSLSYVGPSERFRGTARAARRTDRPVFAKLQIGVTHEIATVPHFPVYHKLAEKFVGLRKQGAGGAMASWNFGNILSPNTELANRFAWAPQPPSVETHLKQVAVRDFGAKAAPGFVAAWRLFSNATDHYPYSIALVYWGPQNFGPANPLFFDRVDRHMPITWMLPAEIEYDAHFDWMDYTEFGDRLDNFVDWPSTESFITCFDRLVGTWRRGVERMRRSMRDVPVRLKANAEREYTVGAAVLSQFTTVRNFTQFTHLRDHHDDAPTPARRRSLRRRMIAIAEDEIRNAASCKLLAMRNDRLGFHGEAFGYVYTPAKIDAKIRSVKRVIREMRARQ